MWCHELPQASGVVLEMRQRSYIPYPERLAATLACLLPQEQRDDLRRRKVGRDVVIGLFDFHHVAFHAAGGSDEWFNLHPMPTHEHKERTAKIDIPAIAKAKRLTRDQQEFCRRILAKEMGRNDRPKSKWPSGRKLQGRGFERKRALNAAE